MSLLAGVVASHEIGFWLGSRTRSSDEPFDRQISLVQTSTAALVAFLIGFAFREQLRASSIGWMEIGDQRHPRQRTIDGGGSSSDQRGHRFTFDAPRYGEKTSAHADHASIGVGMIGFGNGRVGRRFSVLDAVYGIVLAAALWMIIDLDYPGIGIIRVSNLPLVEALATMK